MTDAAYMVDMASTHTHHLHDAAEYNMPRVKYYSSSVMFRLVSCGHVGRRPMADISC